MWLKLAPCPLQVATRFVHRSPVNFLNQKWRIDRGLPMNPNSSGVLTGGPDYSFLDGRPTPYGSRQKERILKHHQIAKDIIEMTAEVDFAVARHERMVKEEEERRRRVIEGKLKAKGASLLKTKSRD